MPGSWCIALDQQFAYAKAIVTIPLTASADTISVVTTSMLKAKRYVSS
jgi:hypothetical protein